MLAAFAHEASLIELEMYVLKSQKLRAGAAPVCLNVAAHRELILDSSETHEHRTQYWVLERRRVHIMRYRQAISKSRSLLSNAFIKSR